MILNLESPLSSWTLFVSSSPEEKANEDKKPLKQRKQRKQRIRMFRMDLTDLLFWRSGCDGARDQ
jgi:hypothetical protein